MAFLHKLIRAAKVAWAVGRSVLLLVLQRPRDRSARAAWLTKTCRRVLTAAEVTWEATGLVPQRGAVISNHLSYIDILVHAALRPCVFVAAIEIRQMPLIGWMSMMAGTVYVTRGAGGSAAKAADGMAEGFDDGLPVVFFPEGGTGVGDQPLLPLHSGLLSVAMAAGAPITAAYLGYTLGAADLAAGRTTRNDVHWGSQTLPAHLWNLFELHTLHAVMHFAPGPILFSAEALKDRKIAADEARDVLLDLALR